jgi:hypothetical protein
MMVSPIPDKVSPTPEEPLQAIKIESETLRGAEEADYNLMERIIERRLRKDKSTMKGSMDELAVRSIMASEDGGRGSAANGANVGGGDEEEDDEEKFYSPQAEAKVAPTQRSPPPTGSP